MMNARDARVRGGRRMRLLAGILWLSLGGVACGGPAAPAATAPAEAAVTEASAQVVRSPHGAVASAAVPATEVGARVLAQGGSAVDAAVATGFALAVSEPAMSGIAGRASIVIRTPDGRIHGIDGLNEVPAGFTEGGTPGYERAAVPGTLAALVRALDEHGSWPLERVMAPAIRLAEEGFLLTRAQANRYASAAEDLALHPGARGIFLRPDGGTWEAGDRLVQPELARTLRAVAEGGVDVFYRGWIADSIAADMARSGGFITRDDLARYEARPAIQVQGTYRGLTVASNFRPASGHSVIQALQTLEAIPGGGELMADEAAWASLVGQAMHLAIQDRNLREAGEEADARRLTSMEHARERAGAIRVPAREAGAGLPGSWVPSPGADAWDHSRGELVTAAADRDATTHFSVADGRGTVVSVTQSLGPSLGTRVVTPGLGFLYATRLGSEPGSRPSSTISPTLVLDRDGTPLLALGGAGDARIISAVIQVIGRRFGQGMTLEEAMAAPRVHPTGDQALMVEEGPGGWSAAVHRELEAVGMELTTAAPGYFGRVHAVELTPGGIVGVAEPRWEGSAVAPVPGGRR